MMPIQLMMTLILVEFKTLDAGAENVLKTAACLPSDRHDRTVQLTRRPVRPTARSLATYARYPVICHAATRKNASSWISVTSAPSTSRPIDAITDVVDDTYAIMKPRNPLAGNSGM